MRKQLLKAFDTENNLHGYLIYNLPDKNYVFIPLHDFDNLGVYNLYQKYLKRD